MKTGHLIQVAATFDATPIDHSLSSLLIAGGIADELGFVQFTQLSEFVLSLVPSPSAIRGAVVLLRVEDWLREDLGSPSDASSRDSLIRQKLRVDVEEFVSQFTILSRFGKQIWLLACPSDGWIAQQCNLTGLCRTYTNLAVARVRGLPHVTVLNWPTALQPGRCEDRDSDRSSRIPFTPDAFRSLGESIGQQIARTVSRHETGSSPAVGGSPELAAYLGGLQVRVRLAPACAGDRPHVDRLLRTVSAFSLTGETPGISETAVESIAGSTGCVLVSVADRISDYGCNGLMVLRFHGDTLFVDSMALSCTVLGKQVEYAVLSALGRMARGRACTTIVFGYQSSGRNQTVLSFLRQVADEESDSCYRVRADAVDDRIAKAAVNPGAWKIAETGV